ncbi:membrane protein insertase YidC, partial [Alteromonas sp. 5E99-2]|uniref:membrane protein insertase YidC n=1 Tax=Alteromonas sp. 5E99-2 TaxID=2817683 RepID=UPI001A98BAF6
MTDVTTPSAASETGTATTTPDVTEAAVEAPRLMIETPELVGSLSLQGARIDDLSLTQYRETLEEGSPIVRLLKPVGEAEAYFATFGWAAAEGLSVDQVPGPDTIWDVESGEIL